MKWKCRLLNNYAVNAKLLRNEHFHFMREKSYKKLDFRCWHSTSGHVSVQWAVNSVSGNGQRFATSIRYDFKYRVPNLQIRSSKSADTELNIRSPKHADTHEDCCDNKLKWLVFRKILINMWQKTTDLIYDIWCLLKSYASTMSSI